MKAVATALVLSATPVVACEIERSVILSQLDTTGLSVIDEGTIFAEGNGCKWGGLKLASGPYLQIPIGEIEWTIKGLNELLQGTLGPVTIDAHLKDLQLIAVPPNDPGLAYLMTLQQRHNLISGHMDIRFDPVLGQFEVNAFRADFPDQSYVDVAGLLEGDPSLADGSMIDVIEGLTLAKLNVAIRNNAFLDSFAISALSGVLMGAADPKTLVETAKTTAILAIGGLPDAVFDKDTRGALATFVADGPMVRGELSVELAGETGLVFAGLKDWAEGDDHFGVSALTKLLTGTVIRAEYTPWSAPK